MIKKRYMIKKISSGEKKKASLGDNIVTNSKFSPAYNGTIYKGQKGLKGTIINIYESDDEIFYGILFDKQLEWQHNLNGIILEKKAYYLNDKQFKIIPLKKYKSKEETEFNKALYYIKTINNSKLINEIKDRESNIKYKIRSIKDYEKSIKREKNYIKEYIKEIDILKKRKERGINIKDLERQFQRLKRNKKIKKIEASQEEKAFIITTNDLIYKKTNRTKKDFELGAYIIVIPFDISVSIQAINYKKHFKKAYWHPCINSSTHICMGTEVKERIEEYRKKGQIDLVTFLLINFLEEPNYGEPYTDDLSFMCAQKVTIKPHELKDWLNNSYWNSHEKWDDELYNKQRRELTKLEQTEEQIERNNE